MIYQYRCQTCGELSDIDHPMGKKKRKCPACGELALKRVYTAPAIHFGPGFPGNDAKKKRESWQQYVDNQGEQHQE